LVDDLAGVLARARASGVKKVITVGTDPEDAKAAIKLAEENEGMWAVIGIHPHKGNEFATVETIRGMVGHPKVVGIGETGMDYHYEFADRENQRKLFGAHLELAREVKLPVVVHCREAFEDVLGMVREAGEGIRGVVHCFSGGEEQARQFLEMGWYISFSGTVTFKRSDELRRAARYVGMDRILVETDCPYLSPEPVRKMKTNEPANVLYTAKLLAEMFGVSLEEFAAAVGRNAGSIFNFGLEEKRKIF
jgi:TatD DNase family protein